MVQSDRSSRRLPMRTVLLIASVTVSGADLTFGVWNLNPGRSTFTGSGQPRSLRVQIEPHVKGEVFTMDRMEGDGSARSSSSILYFDGAPRNIRDFELRRYSIVQQIG